MTQKTPVYLRFASQYAEQLRTGLSAVVAIDETLWVANDETTSVERLSAQKPDHDGNPQYGGHAHFDLQDYLRLPQEAESGKKTAETDTEGMAYADGYLWLVGSHSLTRGNPDKHEDGDTAKRFQQLATLKRDGNRFLLARIPVANGDHGLPELQKRATQDGVTRTAARLRANASGDELTDALRSDPHLRAFLDIPSKENGLDIEGLAVTGQRVFLGLRGPVLRGWAVILELVPVEDASASGLLRLTPTGPEERPYRKHFLNLAGRGIRDLCVQGDDLLVLAGPTMDLEGPLAVYRWRGGATPAAESLVEAEELEVVLPDMPVSPEDHAEGVALFPQQDGEPGLLVVYDPSAATRQPDKKTVIADLFALD